jgi:hypothetical protein
VKSCGYNIEGVESMKTTESLTKRDLIKYLKGFTVAMFLVTVLIVTWSHDDSAKYLVYIVILLAIVMLGLTLKETARS